MYGWKLSYYKIISFLLFLKWVSPIVFCSIPVHTIFDTCPRDNGIRAMAMTRDAKYLATISDAEIQVRGPLGQPACQMVPCEHLCLKPCGICGSLGGWMRR